MKIYKSTKGQLWPIVVQLYDKKYELSPFVAGLFYGDAKPTDVDSILNDFVNELKLLINNGVKLHEKIYSVKLVALIADGQARAYLKYIKGPIAFFGCERCTVEGITKERKRIYPDINCEKRTKNSFTNKVQPEHHQKNVTTLIGIPGFDPVKDVVLDSMHLLFLGVMKYLLIKWVEIGSLVRLKRQDRKILKKLMDSISEYVPSEFQRKIFDIQDVAHWKATQYRFMLLYARPIVLKIVLDTAMYKHFMLLHVACRILCSEELAVSNVDYADELLKKFFVLMPTFYGEACQVMNFHNLIHVADDVRYLQAPLNDFSSFGERTT
ncbi:GSCOCG00012971001-RA-CDS [Cotesia congregata]|nr:GSCOCG00012971001-RA-CDS [Cotesia congregata]